MGEVGGGLTTLNKIIEVQKMYSFWQGANNVKNMARYNIFPYMELNNTKNYHLIKRSNSKLFTMLNNAFSRRTFAEFSTWKLTEKYSNQIKMLDEIYTAVLRVHYD